MSAKASTIKSIARSLAAGFLFGPRKSCACCYEKIDDPDSIGRGICAKCWKAIAKVST